MSRLPARFEELKLAGRTALIPFITTGDPRPEVTVPLMHAMVEAGADILELGVPFSDPMADGPVIQRASERALAHDMSLARTLGLVHEFRSQDTTTPVVLMGYLNPVEVMGYRAFAEAAAGAGVDGVLSVDLPPEEAGPLLDALRAEALDPIFLLSPTTTRERVKLICGSASGFVYYVSLKGVTGSNRLDVGEVSQKVSVIREVTDLPVGVGFGISDAETAARVAEVADAVVVGSALVRRVEDNQEDPEGIFREVTDLLHSMRQAMDVVGLSDLG